VGDGLIINDLSIWVRDSVVDSSMWSAMSYGRG
jgi:hypothetical protein